MATAFKDITGYIDYAQRVRRCRDPVRRQLLGREGLVHRADRRAGVGPEVPPDVARKSSGRFLTIHVYPEEAWDEVLETVDTTSPYALTGAVFSRDRGAVRQAVSTLRNAAGNFYINDKPTGAVVGQQPFGGARASGTNDKAGSFLNLVRWVSPRSIKETFVPATRLRVPIHGQRHHRVGGGHQPSARRPARRAQGPSSACSVARCGRSSEAWSKRRAPRRLRPPVGTNRRSRTAAGERCTPRVLRPRFMRATTAVALLLAVLAPSSISADDGPPIHLTIVEREAGRYDVQWRVPRVLPGPGRPDPSAPGRLRWRWATVR